MKTMPILNYLIQINILMNYLLDRYIFAYLPFEVSDELKHSFASAGMSTVKFADWFCKIQDIRKFYGNHTSFLAIEFLYPLLCLMTLIHAYRHGGRYLYTWIGTTIYVLAAASLYLWSQNFDYQWNAQGLLSFLGGRAPLSAIFGTQQLFFYVAFVFIQRMHLPSLVQGPATGIAVLLLKIPYHIIGTKLIFWTWQIDNPVFADKIYGVPWIIFVFDVGSACGFVWWLKFSRAFLLPGFYDWKKFVREFLCSTIAAFGGLLFGIALSILLFSTVQLLRLPMSVAVSAFICLHFIIVYIADRNNKNAESRAGNDYWFDELSLATCIHFIFLMMLILGAQSLNPIVSEGIHQPIGSCKAYSRIELPLGKILERQDFLCLKTLDSDHFNFHCLPGRKPPSVDGNDLLEWYPICGKPMNAEIHAEYIAIIWGICLIAATILYQAAAKSGKTPKIYRVIYQSPNRATKKFN